MENLEVLLVASSIGDEGRGNEDDLFLVAANVCCNIVWIGAAEVVRDGIAWSMTYY